MRPLPAALLGCTGAVAFVVLFYQRTLALSGEVCAIDGVTFDHGLHYLVGTQGQPQSIYATCNRGRAACFVDDGMRDKPDQEIPCDQVQARTHRRRLRRAASTSCTLGSHTFTGLLNYIVGERRLPDSIYANCINGKPECYSDDGIADTPGVKIPCNVTEIEQRGRRLGVLMDRDHVWPERVVCVKWDEQFSEKGTEFFKKAVDEYQTKADITFLDVSKCRETYGEDTKVCNNCKTAVSLKVSKSGCFANVGYFEGDEYKPELNVGEGCEWYNTYLHEMGHVIGLFHEQAHPQREIVIIRDKKLPVDASNYVKDKRPQPIGYDKMSIMHYSGDEMCIPKEPGNYCDIDQEAGEGCTVPTEEHCDRSKQDTFGKGEVLSDKDIESIKELYKDVQRNPKSPGGNPAPATATPAPTTAAPAPTTDAPAPTTPPPATPAPTTASPTPSTPSASNSISPGTVDPGFLADLSSKIESLGKSLAELNKSLSFKLLDKNLDDLNKLLK